MQADGEGEPEALQKVCCCGLRRKASVARTAGQGSAWTHDGRAALLQEGLLLVLGLAKKSSERLDTGGAEVAEALPVMRDQAVSAVDAGLRRKLEKAEQSVDALNKEKAVLTSQIKALEKKEMKFQVGPDFNKPANLTLKSASPDKLSPNEIYKPS